MNYNRVIIGGNLTRDPEIKYTPKGTAVCKIGVAINREWKDDAGEKKSEVTFVDVDFFGRTAEAVSQYMKKGRPILIEGRLKFNQWENKNTHQKESRLTVSADSFQFVGSKNDSVNQPSSQTSSQSTGPVSQPSLPASQPAPTPEEDDVPF